MREGVKGLFLRLDRKGFTLIEAIVTMVVVLIVGYIVADAVSKGIRAYLITDQRKEALDQSRVALERIVREIRDITVINSASATTLCFRQIDDMRVNYIYSAGEISRKENWALCTDTGERLASGMSFLAEAPFNDTGIFSYVMIDNSVTQSPAVLSNIKIVKIGLKSAVSGEILSLTSDAYPRNMR